MTVNWISLILSWKNQKNFLEIMICDMKILGIILFYIIHVGSGSNELPWALFIMFHMLVHVFVFHFPKSSEGCF
jgi:hypothetical protein